MAERQSLGDFVDRHTTRFTRCYAHTVEEVWNAITDPSAVDLWFIPQPAVEFRAGGRWSFVSPDDPLFQGSITAYEPSDRIEYRYDNGSNMSFALTDAQDGCVLHFEHTIPADFVAVLPHIPDAYGWDEQPAGPGTPSPSLNASWHSNLDGLERFLSGADEHSVTAASRREREDPEGWRELVDAYRDHISATAPRD